MDEKPRLGKVTGSGTAKVSDPPDFEEGGREYRRNILVSTSLTVVLLTSTSLKPALFGVEISVSVMWLFLGISHIYFFLMWRLTAPIGQDREKTFWNIKGLYRQAIAGGTKGFPGKTKAQILLIRALPIWAFIIGMIGILYGFYLSVLVKCA